MVVQGCVRVDKARRAAGSRVSLLGVLFSKVSVVMVSQILTIFWSRPWSCCEEVLDTGRRDHRHDSAPVPTIVRVERASTRRAGERGFGVFPWICRRVFGFIRIRAKNMCIVIGSNESTVGRRARAGGHAPRSASISLATSRPCKAARMNHLRASSRSLEQPSPFR